jgi:hypothetical protein
VLLCRASTTTARDCHCAASLASTGCRLDDGKVLNQLDWLGYRTSRHADYVADTTLWVEQATIVALIKYRAKSLASEHPELAEQFDVDAK